VNKMLCQAAAVPWIMKPLITRWKGQLVQGSTRQHIDRNSECRIVQDRAGIGHPIYHTALAQIHHAYFL